jgi:hypothetical protein
MKLGSLLISLLSNRIWGPSCLLFSGYWGLKWLGRDVNHSHPSNAEEWVELHLLSPICLYVLDRENFSFLWCQELKMWIDGLRGRYDIPLTFSFHALGAEGTHTECRHLGEWLRPLRPHYVTRTTVTQRDMQHGIRQLRLWCFGTAVRIVCELHRYRVFHIYFNLS